MRLTLRTLLAFLDNAPLPNDEREPIQRVLDSNPAAEELVQRIRRVLTQPRLASPAVETAGVLQANQVAAYLDGTLDIGLTKRLEQICLTNDAALSEIAALHQILSDWIDQPAPISEGLRQRLYQMAPSDVPSAVPSAGFFSEGEAAPAAVVGVPLGEASSSESAPESLEPELLLTERPASSDVASSVEGVDRTDGAQETAAPQRVAGREALQTAASLLDIRPWQASVAAESASDQRSKPTPASVMQQTEESEERSSGGWFLVVLVLVAIGFMWWNQRPMWFVPEMAVQVPVESPSGEALPAALLDESVEAARGSASGDLIAGPKMTEGAADGQASLGQRDGSEPTWQRTAPSATLPPIQLSSSSLGAGSTGANALGANAPPVDSVGLGASGLGSAATALAEGLPALPPPRLDQLETGLADAEGMIPAFAPEAELAVAAPTAPSVATDLPPLTDGDETADPFPLAELKPTPLISALPSVEDEATPGPLMAAPLPSSTVVTTLPDTTLPDTTLPPDMTAGLGLTESAEMSGLSEPMGGNPLVPAPLATSPPEPAPVAAPTGPLEWGQQVGTVVIENAATRDPQDEWIVVLPGGRSKLQVRSPRGNSWNFIFSGVSRYQLQEQQGLPQLNVQRCFMIFSCNSPDESLEIQTPKGKLWITSLTPQAEIVLELRPFLPQGFTAQETAPRYYLGCLGIQGRVMIEHQQREEVVFANKWFVVRPDGEVETFQAELTPGIAQALTDLRSDVIAPEVNRLGGLVQSEAGMDELFSMASGQQPALLPTSADERSLAGMWSYCLGQMEPAFAILNDPQMQEYWDVHIQAVISLLQSDPSTAESLERASQRHAGPTQVARRFVGLDPQTVTRSQVAELVGDLEHAQVARRVLAIHALKTLTKETFGFEPNRSTAMNESAVQRWKQWLQDSAQSRISVNPTGTLVPSAQR